MDTATVPEIKTNIEPFPEPIYVTRPSLPKREEVDAVLDTLFDTQCLSNQGPYHQELERALANFLDVPYVVLCCNGTIALWIALETLEKKGEVITTPFTFPATLHAITQAGCTPIFADIDPLTWNLNPDAVEKKINEKTVAILPVHVYGNLAENDRFEALAQANDLSLIYDAAHAFGVKKKGESPASWGDVSMYSFHPTKIFHTFEGGCLTTTSAEKKRQWELWKNFGIADEEHVLLPGLNGKMNEFQSGIGTLLLKDVEKEMHHRTTLLTLYRQCLKNVGGIAFQQLSEDLLQNGQYCPIRIDPNIFALSRNEVYEKLKEYRIFSRKYFYPIATHYPHYKEHANRCPIAEKVAQEILCLPIYSSLSQSDVEKICSIFTHIGKGV